VDSVDILNAHAPYWGATAHENDAPEHGILTIDIPKSEESKQKKIAIKTA
jgi:hypothetical protein